MSVRRRRKIERMERINKERKEEGKEPIEYNSKGRNYNNRRKE